MPTATTLAAFCAAALAILVVPGPSVAYVVARSVEHGRAAGLYSMLGLEVGALVHVAVASLGLAAVITSSPMALSILRGAGAAYLLYLGVTQVLRFGGTLETAPATPASPLRWFASGVVVDLLNPKTALFFVAFLPQFVRPEQGPAAPQIVALGLCFVVMAAVCDGVYAVAAGGFAARVQGSERIRRGIHGLAGGVYVGLAGLVVLT